MLFNEDDVSNAASLIAAAIMDFDATHIILLSKDQPGTVCALAILTSKVFQHYAEILEIPYPALLRWYALKLAEESEEAMPAIGVAFSSAVMLITATENHEELSLVAEGTNQDTLLALAEVAASYLNNIGEAESADPIEVLTRYSGDL